MCKIILKIGDILTYKDMVSHREPCEKGAGISGYSESSKEFFSIKSLSHEEMFDKYVDEKRSSPFWLFHSRLPSKGQVSMMNVQPFSNSSILFCHNGTVPTSELLLALAVSGQYLNGTESDSLLLFNLLKRCNFETAKYLLTEKYSDNFILISSQQRKIWVIGKFETEFSKTKKLVMVKNVWKVPRCVIGVSFNGDVFYYTKQESIIDRYVLPNIKKGENNNDSTQRNFEDFEGL